MVRVSAQARELTRARLLDAAAAAFARDGLAGANINDISLAAGLAKGTVYNYFPSKDALFAAVVEQACRRTVGEASDPGTGSPTRERLLALVSADVAWAVAHEPFARVLMREVFSGEPEQYARVVQAAAPYVGGVEQVLHDGVDRGEVRADRPVEQMALVFTGLGLMTLAQSWGSGGAWPATEQIPGLVVELFLDGAAAQPAAGSSAGARATGHCHGTTGAPDDG